MAPTNRGTVVTTLGVVLALVGGAAFVAPTAARGTMNDGMDGD